MGNNNPSNKVEPNKMDGIRVVRNKDGTVKPGSVLNPAGRPKRKTLTELIHAKLDETPGAWDAIVGTVIQKILKDKEKEVIKTFWQYTDGMPKQAVSLSGDEDNPLKVEFGDTLKKLIEKSYGKYKPGDSGEGN